MFGRDSAGVWVLRCEWAQRWTRSVLELLRCRERRSRSEGPAQARQEESVKTSAKHVHAISLVSVCSPLSSTAGCVRTGSAHALNA